MMKEGNLFKSDFLLLSGHIMMMKNTVFNLKWSSPHKAMIKTHSKIQFDKNRDGFFGCQFTHGYFLAALPS